MDASTVALADSRDASAFPRRERRASGQGLARWVLGGWARTLRAALLLTIALPCFLVGMAALLIGYGIAALLPAPTWRKDRGTPAE